jgi:recombination protein RecR
MKYPTHLQKLIQVLKKLPGVGSRSAERFAFQLIEWPEHDLKQFGAVVQSTAEEICFCGDCGALSEKEECAFCSDRSRKTEVLSVVRSAREIFSIESTGEFKGLYHVLGGVLSPLDGIGPEHLRMESLFRRIRDGGIKEVILALDATLEGDATALYIKNELENTPIKLTRLAFGLPMGSALDYVDGGTLARAFMGRGSF